MSSTPSNTQNVRVRFAPSPTGQLHVGNARTALYNWLYARQKGGAYVLRIEDTDVERSEDRHEVQLIEDLKWLGFEWDEGPDVGGQYAPYRQSDRMKLYHDYAVRLLSEGKAYLCFCSAEELENDRKRAMAEHRSPHYSGKCRALAIAESKTRHANGEEAAIRLLIPQKPIRFHDMVHGIVEFPNDAVSDPIIVRSSGMPVYNYVVVIDDIEMKITHVIRGDDHLSNTPKQVALYEALGAQVPEFVHLSTILGADRERLSKRHGATSIANFREMGILPEALNNYLALLGWAPTGGTRETFTSQELVKEFGLDRVTPSPAVFDIQKLYWLNRHHIAAAMKDDPARIMKLAHAYFVKNGWMPAEADTATSEWFEKMIALLIPSVDQLEDLLARASLFFDFFPSSAIDNPDNADVLETPSCPAVLHSFAAKIRAESGPLTAERFKAIMNEVKIEASAKGKELFHPVRTVITGSHSGPEFDKLIPLIETGSSLILPKKVLNMRERVDAFMHVWKP